MNYSLLASKFKKKDVVVHEGFMYCHDKSRGDKVYYKCVNYRECSGRGKLTHGIFTRTKDHDSHLAPVGIPERRVTIEQLRKGVRDNPSDGMGNIYNEVATRRKSLLKETATAVSVPPIEEIRNVMQYERSKARPVLASTIEAINLSSSYSQYNGVPFVFLKDRIMMFTKSPTLNLLANADCIFMDGTFFVAPSLFTQLYTLHVLVKNALSQTMVCTAYFLLPNRQKDTYVKMFHILQERCPIRSLQFQTDFEAAAINAVNQVFPNAAVRGCFFHYTQCIIRKMKSPEIGLTTAYNSNVEYVVKLVKRCCVLPLVKHADIMNAYDYARSTLDSPDIGLLIRGKMEKLIDYVFGTWVGPSANFGSEIWSRYNIKGPRTNNHVEGFHSALNKSVHTAHPNIYKFIDIIKGEQRKQELKLMQIATGGRVTAPKKKYVDLEKRVQAELAIYSNSSELAALHHFMDQVGYYLHV